MITHLNKYWRVWVQSHVIHWQAWSRELHEWSENVVNVENWQFLTRNCKFLLVNIKAKWKQSVCFITLPCSSTFYSLSLSFFVLEIFKFKYGKFFIRNSPSISKFEWFEQPRQISMYIPSIYYHESIFLLKGNSTIKFNNWILAMKLPRRQIKDSWYLEAATERRIAILSFFVKIYEKCLWKSSFLEMLHAIGQQFYLKRNSFSGISQGFCW